MDFNEGDTVSITCTGLLLLSKEAPDDFHCLQSLETTEGKLLHIEDDVLSVEFAPELVVAIPTTSARNETPQEMAGPEPPIDIPAPPEESGLVRILGSPSAPGVGAAFAGPVNEATKHAMERYELNSQTIGQTTMAFNILSLFSYIQSGESQPSHEEREPWQQGSSVPGRELSNDERVLYVKAMARLGKFMDKDIDIQPEADDE